MKIIDYIANRNDNLKYNPIYTYDDLKRYWVRRSADLGYPLTVEAKYKRDRYIMNKEAMNKVFNEISNKVLLQHETELFAFYNNVISKAIRDNTEDVMNTLHLDPCGQFKAQNPRTKEFSLSSALGRSLGMAIAKNIDYVLDDMIHGKL